LLRQAPHLTVIAVLYQARRLSLLTTVLRTNSRQLKTFDQKIMSNNIFKHRHHVLPPMSPKKMKTMTLTVLILFSQLTNQIYSPHTHTS